MINKILINQVKQIPLLEIIGYYDLYYKDGFLLCPFHEEDTPSAKIYIEENVGYCFGCNKLFDSIELIKVLEDLDFKEAVMFLYNNFSNLINFKNKEISNLKNINLYKVLNRELRNIFKQKMLNCKIYQIAQIIDLNALNNILILKMYKNMLNLIVKK